MESVPKSLYDLCLDTLVSNTVQHKISKEEIKKLPNHIFKNILHKIHSNHLSFWFEYEIDDCHDFDRLLSVRSKCGELIKMFEYRLLSQRYNLADKLERSYESLKSMPETDLRSYHIDMGLRLGGFFIETGTYSCSIKVLRVTEELCHKFGLTEDSVIQLLECYNKKFYAQMSIRDISGAENTHKKILSIIDGFKDAVNVPNLATIYCNFSSFHLLKSDFIMAAEWSDRALRSLDENLPNEIIIKVLKQAAKSSISKCNLRQAGFIMKQAFKWAKKVLSYKQHPYYSDLLSDYGFYLLNSGDTKGAVKYYKKLLTVRKELFSSSTNIPIAVAQVELAYALYVHEYKNGRFREASDHANMALDKLSYQFPSDHILMASAKKVKALIMEEIALDIPEEENISVRSSYLNESEQLHKEVLASCLKTYGEKNLVTANQYANLGRLYQTMKRMDESEQMHLKAIAIKKEIFDHGIAVNMEQLASLYNYQMHRYADAEKMYTKSIKIKSILFGQDHPGLEYDYRGMINIYTNMHNSEKVTEYTNKLNEWKTLRAQPKAEENRFDDILSLNQIVDTFQSMDNSDSIFI